MEFPYSVSGCNSYRLLSFLHQALWDHWLLLILQGKKFKPMKIQKYFSGAGAGVLSSLFFTGISRHVQKFCKI